MRWGFRWFLRQHDPKIPTTIRLRIYTLRGRGLPLSQSVSRRNYSYRRVVRQSFFWKRGRVATFSLLLAFPCPSCPSRAHLDALRSLIITITRYTEFYEGKGGASFCSCWLDVPLLGKKPGGERRERKKGVGFLVGSSNPRSNLRSCRACRRFGPAGPGRAARFDSPRAIYIQNDLSSSTESACWDPRHFRSIAGTR